MQDLVKMKWHFIHVRRRSPWYIYLWWIGLSTKTVNNFRFDHRLKHVGSADHKVLVWKRDWESQRKAVLYCLNKEPGFLYKAIARAYQEHARFARLCKGIYRIYDFVHLSNQELIALVEKYRMAFFRCAVYSLLPVYVEEDISTEIRRRMSKVRDDIEHDYNVVMTPVKDGAEILEMESLLKLALQWRRGRQQKFQKGLGKHIFDFAWLKNVGYYEDYYDQEYYLRRMKVLSKENPERLIQNIRHERAKRRRELNRVLRLYRRDARLVALIKTINEAIYYRSFRGEQMYQSAKYLGGLFKEIAKRLGVWPYQDVVYFTPHEVIELLRQGTRADSRHIPRRKVACVLMSNGDGKYILEEGEKAQRMAQRIKVAEGKVQILKGQVAYPGLVRGIVKIVKSPSDFAKVKTGDILVAMSTQPNYVPALEKAAAFVTEEGGVLCHASVIAREMKKPCVIGTKIATQIFKDGDRVEVDARQGIVRKIRT